ncbi:MAG: signal peptidase I [Maricaulaceae bacterium]
MTENANTAATTESSDADLTIKDRIISEIKFFAGLIVFIVFFFTTVWGHYKIPSESMLPTLEVGDHVYVSKFAYGYSRHSLPFGLHRLPIADGKQMLSRLPKRGDVVVFRNPVSKIIMIKRLTGLPGDTIETRGGRLYVNNQLIDRTETDNFTYRPHRGQIAHVTQFKESLPGEKNSHLIYEVTDEGTQDNRGPFTIPKGHVFFMGDNRDNSVDSRATSGPGMVPVDHLIGRADSMMFSFKKCVKEEGFRCPSRRFFKGL